MFVGSDDDFDVISWFVWGVFGSLLNIYPRTSYMEARFFICIGIYYLFPNEGKFTHGCAPGSSVVINRLTL